MTVHRAAYTAGLRQLADLLDNDASLPLPYPGTSSPLTIFVHGKSLAPVLALRDVLEDAVTHRDTTSSAFPVDISGHLAGLNVTIHIGKDAALVDPQPAPAWPLTDPRLGLDERVSA